MTTQIPSTDILKSQAKRLRADLASQGNAVSHAATLEMVAHQWGARDWNTLSARASIPAQGWTPGDRVSGRYLGQPFKGVVKAAKLSGSGMWSLTLRFDEAVDVVTSPLFSNLRRQVNAVVGANGVSPRRTSDGQPHLVLDPR
ncbi:glyoxalase superfamily protein [uncultured Sulfitobacter sp.]|uniref:glyoxalase superfamily protein n=1 Tax=uncultured Sulfitobacter sp. TaxID=191468 RepID=UPI0030D80EF8|tara:strand:+ start:43860 stop:44288 length:429 start_codon:yes stop_codon:yes gene_type:complete